jgi:hypothetical protein
VVLTMLAISSPDGVRGRLSGAGSYQLSCVSHHSSMAENPPKIDNDCVFTQC